MSSRDIRDLCPELQLLFHKFDARMQELNVQFIVTCTYRSKIEQNALYAQGRTKPGKKVTNARGGQSRHNNVDSSNNPASHAFDIVIMLNGKPDYDAKHETWATAGRVGVDVGLEWGGNWKGKLVDRPHFQLKDKQ